MQKEANRWKQLLRIGQLGGKDLGRIIDSSGVASQTLLQNSTKSDILSLLNPQRLLAETQHRIAANVPKDARMQAENYIRSISQSLAKDKDTMSHGLYPHYKAIAIRGVHDGNKQSIRSLIDRTKQIKSLASTSKKVEEVGEEQASLALNAEREVDMLAKKNKRRTHSIWGTGKKYFNKDNYIGKSFPDQVDQSLESGIGPVFDSRMHGISAPLGIGSPFARHEVGHGIFQKSNTKQRINEIKKVDKIIKRHPGTQGAILSAQSDGGPTTPSILLNEAIAQNIASRGTSRSAQRYRSEYGKLFDSDIGDFLSDNKIRDYAKSINDKDPSGVDATVLGHLATNYMLKV